jgi:photosystem II stability/assembly factor-like uncharacterized protein
VGDSGTIIKTVDGVIVWNRLLSGTNDRLRSICLYNENIGFVSGDYSSLGIILKTVDEGANWVTSLNGTSLQLNSVFFPDSLTGYVVGGIGPPYNPPGGGILKTIDGGVIWTYVKGLKSSLGSVYFTNDSVGYAAGDEVMLTTFDGGSSWDTILFTTPYGFNCIHFPCTDTGYILVMAEL